MARRTRVVCVLVLAVLASASLASAHAVTVTQGGAAEVEEGCAFWNGAPGTGEGAGLCAFVFNGAEGGAVDNSPTLYAPAAIVAWGHWCGTQSGCTEYEHQSSLSRADFIVGPLESTATLATTVAGCPLSFKLASSAASPTEGLTATNPPSAWPNEPSVEAGAGVSHVVLAGGSGALCNDPIAHGTAGIGIIFRGAGAYADYDTYGAHPLPHLPDPIPWTMHGTVTDTHGTPIAGAYISDFHRETISDAAGRYTFSDDVVSAEQTFGVFANGYESASRDVTIVDTQSPVNFVLTPASP